MIRSRLQPAIDEDHVLLANQRFDRIYPKNDENYYDLPMPDWMDPVSPDFDPHESEPELSREVWRWLRRGLIVT